MNTTYSYKNVRSKIVDAILMKYQNYLVEDIKNPNIKFLIKLENNVTITIFFNYTVTFQGSCAKSIVDEFFSVDEQKQEEVTHTCCQCQDNFDDVIGCDEVGVGDFFGPLVTCAAYVPKNFPIDYPELVDEIKDSKKLSNEKIVAIYLKLKDRVIYQTTIIDNCQYNDLFDKYQNTHAIKAFAHNNNLVLIENDLKFPKNKTIVIDQFVNENKYFEYLRNEEKVIEKNVKFEVKAESKYLAVAIASIIARYLFLQNIEILKLKYNIDLPLGASNDVKKLVQEYKKNFPTEVKNFIKLHFNDK